MLTNIIIAASVYIIGYPLLFWLIGLADKQFKNWRHNKKLMKKNANRAQLQRNPPVPSYPKWKERLKFTRTDKRHFVLKGPDEKKGKEAVVLPIERNKLYWGLRLLGLIIVLIGAVIGTTESILFTFFFAAAIYIFTLVYGYKSADSILQVREKILKKMFSVARTKLGQSAEYESNPGAIIKVTEWRDLVKLQQVEFDIPDTFGEEGAEGFMKLFNQNFGRETAWIPADDPETGEPGWDFEKGLLTIKAVPPLPRSAPWDEHYVLAKEVAWSFFPIALGVENGLEIMNPATGELENVIGFDLSGEQGDLAKKMGVKMAPRITTSPMVLVGGGTGGGKSLSVDTLVKRIRRSS